LILLDYSADTGSWCVDTGVNNTHAIASPFGSRPTRLLHYRQVVPINLRSLFGLRVIKRSLLTRYPAVAQLRAYALSTYVGISFARARRLLMRSSGDPVQRTLKREPYGYAEIADEGRGRRVRRRNFGMGGGGPLQGLTSIVRSAPDIHDD
jgi:hypothetical protein